MVHKIILVSVCTFCLALTTAARQKTDYEATWKKIFSLYLRKGLTQSAIAEVEKIYEIAKRENNEGQMLKAILYRFQLQETISEDADVDGIKKLELEITTAVEPLRSLLQSVTAEKYWDYFQGFRMRFYTRSQTADFKKEDITTWNITDFHHKIRELFQASISHEQALQETSLAKFEPVILQGNVRYLRPTLYDLLAHRALNYFKSDEYMVNKPIYAFEISDPLAFADAAAFAGFYFSSADSASNQWEALKLFQRLLRFHASDAKKDALIDVDIERLDYVFRQAVMENKEQLYRAALHRIAGQYGDMPAAAQASFLIAQQYAGEATAYEPLASDSNRYAFVHARKICEQVMEQPGESEGKINCTRLLYEIRHKTLRLQTEKINLPGQPFRSLVTWNNFTNLHIRIIRINKKIRQELDAVEYLNDNTYWKKLRALPAVKTFFRLLPDTKDHQKHSTEIAIDALPVGEYALLASDNNDFKPAKDVLAVQFFAVSNLSFIHKERDYFVLNRQTGQPVMGASVQLSIRYYDRKNGLMRERTGEKLITDQNGYFQVPYLPHKDDEGYRMEISAGGDRLYNEESRYLSRYYDAEPAGQKEIPVKTFLFTDRTIYRPGQTLYFKGIALLLDGNKSQLLTNHTTTVFLKDPNGQRIDSLQLTTNAYGSYAGKFTLPVNALNGQFTLMDWDTRGFASVSVEEYKRPRFQATIEQPTGTYRLNDSIEVKGAAKGYAGNYIDGAKVRYRVIRKTIVPLWQYRTSWQPPYWEEMEIAFGQTTTDANGLFNLRFKALPEKNVPQNDQPVFQYEIHADITDITGETRSATTTVSIGWQALKLTVKLPEKLHTDSLQTINVSTTNQHDVFEKSQVTITVYKLQAPDRVFRERYWQQPDTFVITQQEYYTLFPYDEYRNETNPAQWPRLEKIIDKTGSSNATGSFHTNLLSPEPGWYVVEAIAKDKYGEEVRDIKYVQLYNQTSVTPEALGEITASQTIAEPGQILQYRLNTNLDSVFVIHRFTNAQDSGSLQLTRLNRNSLSFSIPVTEAHRGGFGVQIAFVKNNRFFTNEQVFSVPYANKQLQIAYQTFRDRTTPGSKEKWSVRISGYRHGKIAAEYLAAMYDLSLDQYKTQRWWQPSIWPEYASGEDWSGDDYFDDVSSTERDYPDGKTYWFQKKYDILGNLKVVRNEDGSLRDIFPASDVFQMIGHPRAISIPDLANDPDGSKGLMKDQLIIERNGIPAGEPVRSNYRRALFFPPSGRVGQAPLPADIAPPVPEPAISDMQVRRHLHETAFFFPDLKTDSLGNITFSFTMPEAVTAWKWMSLAHTKELAFGYDEKTIVTQKQLMVQPNAPRFLREGDRINFSGKITNLTDRAISGQVQLQLIDATSNQPLDGLFGNRVPEKSFTVPAGQSTPVSFTLDIPSQYNQPVTYRLIARSGELSDGEEAMLPVISNRMLVTESLPLSMHNAATKNFTFDKLLKSGGSGTLHQHALTIEFTSNPAWYAIQAIPYLMEYPYDCAEQTFNRYYANALASNLVNASPRMKAVFARWKTADTTAMLSNLQKNEDLKAVLLQETPWVLQAKNEAQQKKNIVLLFDMVRMSKELSVNLTKLKELQSRRGGFAWFKGGNDDRYMTQYILSGIGHLKKLNALPSDQRMETIIGSALGYLDNLIGNDYKDLLQKNKNVLPADGELNNTQIHYLYMRSFFPDRSVPAGIQKAYGYYQQQAQQKWLQQSRYMQGMIALSMYRSGEAQLAKDIVASLKENAIAHEELGMYWKDMVSGYYWHQAPIESQALLMEAFSEITHDTEAVENMKTWLLKQKQTRHWNSTKATADACYALLLQGTQWLDNTPNVTIALGNFKINSSDQPQEAGTGYFKKVIDEKDVQPTMGNVKVTIDKSSDLPNTPSTGGGRGEAWGAVYWQYFENLDKITPAATPLQLSKKLFVEKNTDHGPVLAPVNKGDLLHVGDKIKVRIEIRTDRDMEYVHLKDMRAACMEPVKVLSSYEWQDGLGYYETTKDASTNFFFGWLPKGTYVFEYALVVTHTGTFSNGVTTIQCMYAPEFTSHSEGIKVNVE